MLALKTLLWLLVGALFERVRTPARTVVITAPAVVLDASDDDIERAMREQVAFGDAWRAAVGS